MEEELKKINDSLERIGVWLFAIALYCTINLLR